MLDEEDGQVSRSLDEYWAIARRRRWYILLPVFACWAIAWAGSWLVPSTFQSEALILVEQQKVPFQERAFSTCLINALTGQVKCYFKCPVIRLIGT